MSTRNTLNLDVREANYTAKRAHSPVSCRPENRNTGGVRWRILRSLAKLMIDKSYKSHRNESKPETKPEEYNLVSHVPAVRLESVRECWNGRIGLRLGECSNPRGLKIKQTSTASHSYREGWPTDGLHFHRSCDAFSENEHVNFQRSLSQPGRAAGEMYSTCTTVPSCCGLLVWKSEYKTSFGQ